MPQPRKRTNLRNRETPLKGVRVLVSRAKKQAGALSSELRGLGAHVLEIPFIEIRKPSTFAPLDRALRAAGDYDWLILTSVNGVHALFERMEKLRMQAVTLKSMQIAAIGPATRKAIEERGLAVKVTPKEYVAEAVVAALAKKTKGKRVLLVRAKVARDVIPRELRKAGATVDVIEAYETVLPAKSRERLARVMSDPRHRPEIITFTSSSTVRNFVDLVGRRNARQYLSKGVQSASIGPVTSHTLREFKLPVHMQAKEYTIQGLVTAITSSLDSSHV